jgi:uncharacterized protein (TIGR00255 family)
MTHSMTGFATRRGQLGPHAWVWDVRSVNGNGLDLRLRVPDWVVGLEVGVRAAMAGAISRGNVSLTCKITRDAGEAGLVVNHAGLRAALRMLAEVEAEAMATGVTLAQASQADVLALRGVVEVGVVEDDVGPLLAALMADVPLLLADLNAARAAEGALLRGVLLDQVAQIDALTGLATDAALARRVGVAAALRDNVKKLMEATDKMDESRIEQELALLAVKADVTEELDRLRAHIAAARTLLALDPPVGRKLDFLMQEFMREANTLCAKAQSVPLTRVGLDLKTVIDQMREQVQNVE